MPDLHTYTGTLPMTITNETTADRLRRIRISARRQRAHTRHGAEGIPLSNRATKLWLPDTPDSQPPKPHLVPPAYPGSPEGWAETVVLYSYSDLRKYLKDRQYDSPSEFAGLVIILDGPVFGGVQIDIQGQEPVYSWDPDPTQALHIVGVTQADGTKPRLDGVVNRIAAGPLELHLHNIELACPPGGVCALGAPQHARWTTVRLWQVDFVRHPDYPGYGGLPNGGRWGVRQHGGAGIQGYQARFLCTYHEHDVYCDNSALAIWHESQFGPSSRTHVQEAGRRQSSYEPHEYLGICIDRCLGEGLDGEQGGYALSFQGYPGPTTVRDLILRGGPLELKPPHGGILLNVPNNYGGVYLTDDGWAHGDVRIERVTYAGFRFDEALLALDGYRTAHVGELDVSKAEGPKRILCRHRGTSMYAHGPTRWADPQIGDTIEVRDYDGPDWSDSSFRTLTRDELDAQGVPGFVTPPAQVDSSQP